MAAFTSSQVESIEREIRQIPSTVFSVERVTVEQDDDPQGEATRVTVELVYAPTSDDERLDSYIAFSRAAHRIVFDILGDDRILRVSYRVRNSGDEQSVKSDDTAPESADKI